MFVQRSGQASSPALFTIIAVQAVVLFWPLLVAAQSKSLLDAGVGAAMYGRCQTDVLSPELRASAAMLGVFAPATVDRITRGADELSQIAAMCAQQLHEHRCTKEVVSVAGDLLMKGNPSGKAAAPTHVNPGTIVGGTAGLVTGVLLGSRESAATGIGAGIIGGGLGAAGGTYYWDRQEMKACIDRQKQLDNMSVNFAGAVSSLSIAALQDLIVSNVRANVISARDADTLIDEASKLGKKADAVFKAMR